MNRTASDAVARAKSAIGHGCIYQLGCGGIASGAVWPWDAQLRCDCSGFVAWVIGYSRHTDNPWYAEHGSQWVNTDAILRDALSNFGLFDSAPWQAARLGDLMVYPGHGGHHGHVGMVSELDATGPSRVIHCSLGNWHQHQDAIQETGVGLFLAAAGTFVARSCLLDYGLGVA